MAYKTEELFKDAMDVVETKKLFFHTHVFEHLGISSSTYYDHFAKESNEYKELEKTLQKNRVTIKTSMLQKWYQSEHPTLQVGLYKLICSDDEREKLSVSYNKNENSGEIKLMGRLDEVLDKLDDQTLAKIEDAINELEDTK